MNVETKLEPCPRERIETKHLRCNGMTPTQWELAAVGQHAPAFADWPEVVAFAQAILAADAEWRERNAPTLAELVATYPDVRFITGRDECGRCEWVRFDGKHGGPDEYGDAVSFPDRADALEWLAAKLGIEKETP